MTTFAPEKFVQTIYNEGVGVTHNIFGKLGFSYMITPNHSIGAYSKLGRSNTQSEGKLDTKSIMADNPSTSPLEHTLYSFDIDSKNYPSQEANLYYNGSVGNLSMDFNADYLQNRSTSNDLQIGYQSIQNIPNSIIESTGLTTNRLIAEKFIISYPVWKGELEIGEEYTNSSLSYDYKYTGASIDNTLTDIHENNFAGFATLSQTFGKVDVSLGLRYEFAKYK